MEKGFIKLSRSFFDNKIWQAARAFSECEAWLDLIQSARFEASPTTSRIGCYEVTWERGQYPASNRFLAKKWGRSEQWVKSFLGKLKREHMIVTDNSQGVNVITLVNYSKYNGDMEDNNPPNNSPNNPLKDMDYNELQELVTHLVTHLITTHAKIWVKMAIMARFYNPPLTQIIRKKKNIIITILYEVLTNFFVGLLSPTRKESTTGTSFLFSMTPPKGCLAISDTHFRTSGKE